MSDNQGVSRRRRNLVIGATCAGGVAAAGMAAPFAAFMLPSNRAKAMGASVEVDISGLAPGDKATIEWRGRPVWILHRTKEMLAAIKADDNKVADPKSERKPGDVNLAYAKNEYRSIKPEYLVVVGSCTHLGCSPQNKFTPGRESFDPEWHGGFYCPCHGALFDLAGRVYKNKPAPDNLKVPPHMYLSDSRILIGEDKKGA
jgi:ubiquinol-cytochrome c reductase iron-sulfur subunit